MLGALRGYLMQYYTWVTELSKASGNSSQTLKAHFNLTSNLTIPAAYTNQPSPSEYRIPLHAQGRSNKVVGTRDEAKKKLKRTLPIKITFRTPRFQCFFLFQFLFRRTEKKKKFNPSTNFFFKKLSNPDYFFFSFPHILVRKVTREKKVRNLRRNSVSSATITLLSDGELYTVSVSALDPQNPMRDGRRILTLTPLPFGRDTQLLSWPITKTLLKRVAKVLSIASFI